ncbi:MAG: aminotransferase class III-fold pyridoxal phosphate-dependent enzyme, partial [Phycisphaerae bacterium]
RRLDTLLMYDEIQTAFGRLGTIFAAELYGIVPDVITFGKALGGGLPVAGFMTRKGLDVLEVGDHAFTFGHFPVGTAAAVATLEVLEQTDLLLRCRRLGEQITARLRELQDRYEIIGDIRGPGLMIGIELVKDRTSKAPANEQAARLVQLGLERGVIFGTSRYGGRGNVVKIKPPLVISDAQVERVMEVFAEACELLGPGGR